MWKIGIDCRMASTDSGLGRYTRELVPQLLLQGHDERFVLFVRSGEEAWLSSLSGTFDLSVLDVPHYSFSEQWRLLFPAAKARIDLLFSPHFNVPLWFPAPYVVTIHDLALHRYPNRASWVRRGAYRLLMRQSVLAAERIIAVSAFTSGELGKKYGKKVASKTTVIREGVRPSFTRCSKGEQEAVRAKYGLGRRIFLYVGNAKEHKNLPFLLEAFTRADVTDAELVLVTGGKEAERLTIAGGVKRLEHVPDDDLPALYSSAAAMVTASLYEGFCLPLLEAAACGCPIIATNGSAIAEVAPPESLLLEPTVELFAQAFRQPPSPPISFFPRSWEAVASETLALLRSALPGK